MDDDLYYVLGARLYCWRSFVLFWALSVAMRGILISGGSRLQRQQYFAVRLSVQLEKFAVALLVCSTTHVYVLKQELTDSLISTQTSLIKSPPALTAITHGWCDYIFPLKLRHVMLLWLHCRTCVNIWLERTECALGHAGFNDLFIRSLVCSSADRRDEGRGRLWLCAETPLSKCHHIERASYNIPTVSLCVWTNTHLCKCVLLGLKPKTPHGH